MTPIPRNSTPQVHRKTIFKRKTPETNRAKKATWEPRKTILWRRSMLVVSSSSNRGKDGDGFTAADKSQFDDKVRRTTNPLRALTWRDLLLLWFHERQGLVGGTEGEWGSKWLEPWSKKVTGVEEDGPAKAKLQLISVSLSLSLWGYSFLLSESRTMKGFRR